MYSFLQKLDQFTDFAQQKVSIHAKFIGEQNHKSKVTSEAMEKYFHYHEEVLKQELEKKIAELSIGDGILLNPSLRMLKDYYLDIFKNKAARWW